MTDYAIITLQLVTILTTFVLAALAITITGLSLVLWLLGKLVDGCWWLVDRWQDFKESTKLWHDENNTNPTI